MFYALNSFIMINNVYRLVYYKKNLSRSDKNSLYLFIVSVFEIERFFFTFFILLVICSKFTSPNCTDSKTLLALLLIILKLHYIDDKTPFVVLSKALRLLLSMQKFIHGTFNNVKKLHSLTTKLHLL